jgi:2-oxoglutarate ferredoxin oxidoreductase subunit alpha
MQKNSLQWKIGGEAGFGIMTTGLIFSRICARGGLKIFAYPEYPSLIRGGHNTYQIAVDAKQATSQIRDVHMLVCLNKETLELQQDQLIDKSSVIYDPKDFKGEEPIVEGKDIVWVPVPMTEIIAEQKAAKVARNTISIGASFGLLNYPWEHVESVIRDWFGKKKPEVIESNISLAKAGYDAVAEKAEHFPYALEAQPDAPKQMVVSGNGASAMGALKAGMKFFAAYPMTPSSDFLSYYAKKERDYDLVVKHTEDEIAAMNMVIGAAFTGARSMTATSGGGFALMGEALGMAGIAEVPVVVVNGQRPGPSTGLPTWTSQADLRFVLHASQGEFPRIVLTPGDAREAFYMTHEAFNLAEKYQLPVVIILDKYNQQSWQSVELFDTEGLSVDRGKLITQEEVTAIVEKDGEYLRFKQTEDGISERALPGMIGARHVGSSYEHEENGYTTEDEDETVRQNDKRFRKLEKFLRDDAKAPELFGPEDADVTVVGWGSTLLPMQEALKRAQAEGISVNYLHFTYIDPFPVELALPALEKAKKTLCVEGNKLGQFEGWVREKTGFEMTDHYRTYGGRPFYAEDILEKVKSL